MSLKLDFDRIRERLGLSVQDSGHSVAWWQQAYAADVRALRAAYKRERSMRLHYENLLLKIGGLAEMPQDGPADNRTIRAIISDHVRSCLALGRAGALPAKMPPPGKRP